MKTDFAAFVFVVNRFDLLRRSIGVFPDLWEALTVVDNSLNGIDSETIDYCGHIGVGVWRPPVPLTYSQSMNWMLKDAQEKEASLIVHFHSDAFSTNPTAVSELLAYARRDLATGLRRACWWTFYDILFAINVSALADIGGCDTRFPDYFTDQDLRRRWELAGWEPHDTCIQGLSHEGSATINSDYQLQQVNGKTFPIYSAIYHLKHGGEPRQEKYLHPYNDPKLSWRP